MKITEIKVKDKPPIKNFEVTKLSNVIVLAGPNGIGKTRLVQQIINLFRSSRPDQNLYVRIETTTKSEVDKWGKNSLSTLDQHDVTALRQHLQKRQKRGKWTSNIVNFDSSRTFEPIRSFAWEWNFPDPFEEEMDGSFLSNPFNINRYEDTIYALYRKIGHYTTEISRKYETLRNAGNTQMPIDPTDPLQKFKDMFNLLLSPKKLVDIPLTNPRLQYREVDGQVLSIESLSSGEREVFTIVFDLLLHEPSDCIIFFDEPEMHLHPELSFRLIRALENVGERNQFIFCTHSPDIITESLEHSVIFIKQPKDDENQAVYVSKDDEKATALNLLGQNLGVIALGRRLVLIEGNETSLDKLTYGEIVGKQFPQYVLVPTGPRQTMLSFSKIVNDVLSKSLWGIDFFMISDHDSSLPKSELSELNKNSGGRLAFLPRYHLENYFLDENVISKMFEKIEPDGNWLRNSQEVKEKFKMLALESIPYTVQLWLKAFLQAKAGIINISIKDVEKMDLNEYLNQLPNAFTQEQKRIESILSIDTIKAEVSEKWNLLISYLNNDNPSWKNIIPGRIILNKFAGLAKINTGRFKVMYINQAKEENLEPFADIINIFKTFDALSLHT
jgi:predicted ATPase